MRLRRLGDMSFGEIAYRGRQEAAKWADRVRLGRAAERTDRARGGLRGATAALARFRAGAESRFFAGAADPDVLEALERRRPNVRREIVAAANAICSRHFDLLGYRGLSFGEVVDWHRDPVAGRQSPLVHWSRLDPLDASRVGDSKVIWELNRHQWLVTLAQASCLTDDARYAQHAFDLVEDWIRANPRGFGINWASSLEVACRLVSWSWTLVLLRESPGLTPAVFERLTGLVAQQAEHVERYLSHYFSPNTHLTVEALGLFYTGVVFGDLPGAARWRETGARILTDESRRQILPDGVYFEHATAYQRYTAEIYLHFLLLAGRAGVEVPAEVGRRLERLLDFLLAVRQPDGALPQIGDADGGWLLPFVRREPADVRGVFGPAAVFFGRSDFAWAAGDLGPEVLWLCGIEGERRFDALAPRAPAGPPSRLFPDGGYAVMRESWSRDGHQLVLDAGPLGCVSTGAHGHADLLSLQCSAFGEPYIVDPGTGCYTADAAWRRHFRSTGAHSTVVIDGLDQAEPAGPFSWHTRPSARCLAWRSTGAIDFVDADHDAYPGVRHRRRVVFVKPDYWIVVDDLEGDGPRRFELRFQFSPRPVTLGPGTWVAAAGQRGRGLWLAPFTAVELGASLRRGQLDPVDGWVSPDYGQRRPAPMVVYAGEAALPIRVVTLIVPAADLAPQPPAAQWVRDLAPGVTRLRLTPPAADEPDRIAVDHLHITVRRGDVELTG